MSVAGDAVGAKIYASGSKVRIETAAGYFLIEDGAAVFVRPSRRMFTDARQSTVLTQWFVPVDPERPCVQLQAAARDAGVAGAEGEWRCERLEAGPGAADLGAADRGSTALWRVTPPGLMPRECWIDSSLRFPVRVEASDGTRLRLDNIRLGAQAPESFVVPSGFHKLDPHALIEHIKRSDVWVEPPASN